MIFNEYIFINSDINSSKVFTLDVLIRHDSRVRKRIEVFINTMVKTLIENEFNFKEEKNEIYRERIKSFSLPIKYLVRYLK